MKRIHVNNYRSSMGILIDLEDSKCFMENHIRGAKNIPYEKIIMNYRELLDKNKVYYLYCKKGRKSRKAASILELYGYNVTQLYNE